eukprot:gb/GECG01007517.1/.p1 GENE.gb/GECG01007517.1/~~gb/GECG01007517.1/.p1  ORF type:complete len:640 (+),score=60.97 gb/GECG01007517.1/:1-1920(+)
MESSSDAPSVPTTAGTRPTTAAIVSDGSEEQKGGNFQFSYAANQSPPGQEGQGPPPPPQPQQHQQARPGMGGPRGVQPGYSAPMESGYAPPRGPPSSAGMNQFAYSHHGGRGRAPPHQPGPTPQHPGIGMGGMPHHPGFDWTNQWGGQPQQGGAVARPGAGKGAMPGMGHRTGFPVSDEYQPMADEEELPVEPEYKEKKDEWMRCRAALRRHEDFSHWLDYVTPDKRRTWPKYEPGGKPNPQEPTYFESADITEVDPTERRNKWGHINPGFFFTAPAANTLEVTDSTVIVTTLKPLGKSSANVIMLTDIDRCQLDYKAPPNYSFMQLVAYFLNSRAGIVFRSQMLFVTMMILMFLGMLFIPADGFGILFLLLAALLNLILVVLSILRDHGLWRGKPDNPNEKGDPYPTWVKYQHQLGLMERNKHHPFGFCVNEDGTYEVPDEIDGDITVEEYEHYRRDGDGRLNSCGCSLTTVWSMLLCVIGLGATALCFYCGHDLLGKAFRAAEEARAGQTNVPSPNTDDTADDDGWNADMNDHVPCLPCVTSMGGYMFFILIAKMCAFGPLPVFYYNYVPRSTCVLNIQQRGQNIASVDLGDIENAKGAASYIMYKSEQRRETELKRDIAYTKSFFSNVKELQDSSG